jgi:glycosyltransferase involved in cell wall biosynthesis
MSTKGILGFGGALGLVPIVFRKKLRPKGAREFAKVFSDSESVAEKTYPLLARKKLRVLHNFIDTSRVRIDDDNKTLEKIENELSGSYVVLFSGRLSVEKGLALLLRAWKRFIAHAGNARLVITGSGPLGNWLSRQALKSPKTVCFLGRVSQESLFAYMKRADLFVLPSTWPDPCPTSILEAIHLGTRVAASNLGGIPEILRKHKGNYLFNPESLDSFVETLKLAYAEHSKQHDDSELGEEFTVKFVGQRLLEEYSVALNSSVHD